MVGKAGRHTVRDLAHMLGGRQKTTAGHASVGSQHGEVAASPSSAVSQSDSLLERLVIDGMDVAAASKEAGCIGSCAGVMR